MNKVSCVPLVASLNVLLARSAHAAVDVEVAKVAKGKRVQIVRTNGSVVLGTVRSVGRTFLVLESPFGKLSKITLRSIRRIIVVRARPTSVVGRPKVIVAPADNKSSSKSCHPTCRDGYHCKEGRCVSDCNPPCRGNRVCNSQGKCVSPANSALRESLIRQKMKSPAGAWALEFFLGFGIGHYYAGNSGWGAFGTLAGLLLWSGVGMLSSGLQVDTNCEHEGVDNCSPPVTVGIGALFAGLGGLGRIVSFIAAPILVSGNNRELEAQQMQAGNSSQSVPKPKMLPYFYVQQVHGGKKSYHAGLLVAW